MAGKVLRWTTACAATVLLIAGCSSSSKSSAGSSPPTGPTAQVTGPVTGGKGVSLLAASQVNLAAAGYDESEFFASGTASSYSAVGSLGNDGHWQVQPAGQAAYKTRVVVRAPHDPAKFNGTVLVEWLNVTGGADTPADFAYLQPEILRSGYAWVGVSAQKVGVSGGGSPLGISGAPAGGLKGSDPARYGSLDHPGDAFSFDMFSQVGRTIRNPGSVKVLGPLHPQRVIAIGESQSAFALTTYINAIQPQAHVFDGFLVHSRSGGAFPLGGGGLSGAISGAVHIRDDIDVPVLMFETETDEMTLGYFHARQPDNTHIRLWDVAGGAHADAFLVGSAASQLGCTGMINDAPTHFVLNAALHQLDRWVHGGAAPASAPRMDVTIENGSPVVQRDRLGVAIGGVRSAAIDVPVAAYSGVPADTSNAVCVLFGSTHPLDAVTLHQLYPTKSDYLQAFTSATNKAIAAGYILPADRAEILAQAQRFPTPS